jgi:succinate dehydrogenase / fumarate reductase cytochrome b subunit
MALLNPPLRESCNGALRTFSHLFPFAAVSLNMVSVFSENVFNSVSHGLQPLVQFVMQPILAFGVIFHFVMGFVLEIQNRNSTINLPKTMERQIRRGVRAT